MISVINGFNKISFGSTKPKKTETADNATSSQEGKIRTGSADPSQKLLVKKTTIIPPKRFSMTRKVEELLPSIERDSDLHHKYIKMGSYFEENYARFDSKFNPKTLEILDEHITSTSVSNFCLPLGTIGLSSTLDECITTDQLYQCAGIAFIDKKHNLQTLVHVCPSIPNMNNAQLIRYILSFSKPEDLEIYIAPGMMEETDKTIEFLVDTIKNKNEDYNINFVNFPDSKNTTLVLRNGELMCTKSNNNRVIETNPINRIIYA